MGQGKPVQINVIISDSSIPFCMHIRQIHISCSERIRDTKYRMSGEQLNGLGKDLGFRQYRGQANTYLSEKISWNADCLRHCHSDSLQGKEFYPFVRNLSYGACCSVAPMSDRCRGGGMDSVELVFCLIMFW